jgi:hypothetical protein
MRGNLSKIRLYPPLPCTLLLCTGSGLYDANPPKQQLGWQRSTSSAATTASTAGARCEGPGQRQLQQLPRLWQWSGLALRALLHDGFLWGDAAAVSPLAIPHAIVADVAAAGGGGGGAGAAGRLVGPGPGSCPLALLRGVPVGHFLLLEAPGPRPGAVLAFAARCTGRHG